MRIVTRNTRRFTGALVALLLSQTALTAIAQETVDTTVEASADTSAELPPPLTPSATGGYLAGRKALSDLRIGDAARYFGDATRSDWDNPVLAERAFVAYAVNGEIEESAAAADRTLANGPNDLASLVVAVHDLRKRRYEDALAALSAPGSDTYTGVTASIVRAWVLAAEGKSEDAQASLTGSAFEGLDPFLAYHRMLLAELAGDTGKAAEFGKLAIEIDPFVARVVEAYARVLGNARRFDEAKAVIANFESQGLSYPSIDLIKPALAARKAPGPFSTDAGVGAAESLQAVGVVLSQEGAPEIAAVMLRLGMYLAPELDSTDLVFGQLLDNAGQHDEANVIYDAIAPDSPIKPLAVVRAAQNLDALGDQAQALARLADIAARNPTDVDALSVLGDMQRGAKLFAESAETYTRVIDLVAGDPPGKWRYYYVRGIAYERSRQWPLAEADFKKALELNPDQPQVLNYLGYSWVDQGINLLPALDMIKKAVAAAPNDGYIIDSLGWAYYRLGRYDEAVVELERAVNILPTDPEINDHLGDAYWRAGRQLEARFQYNVAMTVDEPDGDVRKRIAEKLAASPAGPSDQPVIAASADQPAPTPAAGDVTPAVGDATPAAGDGTPDADTTPAAPADTAASPATAEAPSDPAFRTVTVTRGDSLWTIARENYGQGAAFDRIVKANPDTLANPDLIMPGQVLVLPDLP